MTHEIWSVLLLAGLYGWIGSTLTFIFKAFPGRGRFESRPSRFWGACLLVCFGVWIAGLLNA